MRWLVAFILLLGAAAVRLSVQHGEYVELCCGEPCKWLTFRLNRTSSEIWLHNAAYMAASRTYYQSQGGLRDSDVFYFNDVVDVYRLRLQMRYFPVPSVLVGRETLSIDGTLGLGPRSQLWTIWNNYTLTKRRLDIGHYDNYGQRDYRQRPPILDLHEHQQVTLGDGSSVSVSFDIATTETFVPYGMNLSQGFSTIKVHSDGCEQMYARIGLIETTGCLNNLSLTPDQFQTVTLNNGVEYEAIDYVEGEHMIIGTRFIDDFFWFRSMDAHSVIIAEDAFFLDYVGVTVGVALGVSLLFAFWLTIAESKQDRTAFYEFLFMYCAEALSYFADAMLLLVTLGMLDWSRYITQYAQISALYAELFIPFVCLLSASAFIISLYRWHDYASHLREFKHNGFFRIVLFATSQTLVLWLCLIEQHETTFDRLFVALLITLLGILQLTASAIFFIQRQLSYSLICAGLFLTTTIFHVSYNLIPSFRYGNMRHNFAVACFLWVYFFELVPAFIISMILKMRQGLAKAEHLAAQSKLTVKP